MATKRGSGKRLKTTLAVMTACVIVASLAFISLQVSLLAACFMAIMGFAAADLRRRRFWENGLSFRMKKINDEHSLLSQKIAGTRQEVFTLKQTLADVNRRLNDQDERLDMLQPDAVNGIIPPRPVVAAPIMQKPVIPPKMPLAPSPRAANAPIANTSIRAVRPGQPAKTATPNPALLDTPDEDYKELSDVVVRELVSHAVRSRTIDVFVQPIVRLPQRKVRYYEIFARVRARPGLYVPARRYMRLARENKAVNDIDTMLLIECLKTIRASAHIERAAPLFVNISGATLKNVIFMKRLLGFVAENRHLAPRLVFELPHTEYITLEAPLREILRGLGRLGCAVSLDHVGAMEFDIEDLQSHHVRFVKIGARTLMPYTRSDKARADLQKKKRALESGGVNIIVEKVESESDLLELLDFDIAYGQGHLFGRPDLEAAYRKRRAA